MLDCIELVCIKLYERTIVMMLLRQLEHLPSSESSLIIYYNDIKTTTAAVLLWLRQHL